MNYCLPQDITPAIFLKEYWQKKPLIIRQGMSEIIDQFTPKDIIELAQDEDITARLIKQSSDDKWSLKISPLSAKDFTNMPEKWSVLVQNMEQWSVELGELWNKFGFIPQWQRDDIMVSYAPKGGSVGKHYDEYDVFLVQGYGHRRWQLGKFCDPSTAFKPNQPIRIFDDMGEILLDEIMAPGDVLYVPARMAHYGVAQDDCLTFSFGLRYPNLIDILDNVNQAFRQAEPNMALTDFNLPLRLSSAPQKTGLLASNDIQQIKQQLLETLAHSAQFEQLLQQAVAQTITSRRYEMLVVEDVADPEEISIALQQSSVLVQDNNCKLVYTENPLTLYANGEWLDELNPIEAKILQKIADGNAIDWQTIQDLLANVNDQQQALALLLDSICNWLDDGWVLLQDTE